MEWDPTQFFREDEQITPHPYALVVLNQPINETALGVLRKHARMTVCADGGANRFYEWAKSNGRENEDLPTTIIGDLDSIHPEIRSQYEKLGVEVIQDEDQYSTDFTKSLRYIRSSQTTPEQNSTSKSNSTSNSNLNPIPGHHLSILILGGLGGRVDQAFSQIHHLYMMNEAQSQNQAQNQNQDQAQGQDQPQSQPNGNLYLISEESITFILQPGPNKIHVPRTNRPRRASDPPKPPLETPDTDREKYLLEENIGIIPLSGPARISTSGFEWDVTDWKTEIGGEISTSNHIRAESVSVTTGVPVLFTVELAGRLKRHSR